MVAFGSLETDVEILVSLMREHAETYELMSRTREVLERAIADPADSDTQERVLRTLWELDSFVEEDLVIHIAKEEDVLFPALRGFTGEIDQVVREMVEQHDEVRRYQDAVEEALHRLDAAHVEVDASLEAVRDGIAATAGAARLEANQAEDILDRVKRLDWMLQGHFGDEEDDLFAPALHLVNAATWDQLAVKARQLDA